MLKDEDVSRGPFDVKRGFSDGARIKNLQPGDKTRHSIIVAPNQLICVAAGAAPGTFCKYNLTVGMVKYKASEGDLAAQVRASSRPA